MVTAITNGDSAPYTIDTPLEDLLAVYGDSSASNWTDPKYTVFRDDTGGAIGFVANHHRAIAWGSPACVPDEATTSALIQNFLSYCESQHLQPVFACVDERVKRLLSKPPFAWHSLTSLREQYIDLDIARQGGSAAAKRAAKAKRDDSEVTVHEGIPAKEDYDRLVEGLTAWQDGRSRKGKQVHTSELKPFRDAEHRVFFIARHPSGGPPQGLLVLSEMLDGYYIKWNISLPDAPSGTSELLAQEAIDWCNDAGVRSLSFGPGAANNLQSGDDDSDDDAPAQISPWKVALLKRTYRKIHSNFKLAAKTEFRRKFPLAERAAWICWPPGVLDAKATMALFDVFKE